MTGRRVVIVLDLDDTLFPERDYVRSGFTAVDAEVRRAFGRSGFGEAAWALFESGRRGRLFDETLERLGLAADASTIESLVAVYRGHRPTIALFPDAERFVRSLAGRARAAIVSDGPLASQTQKVAGLGLERWFEPIVLTDRWGRPFWKPHERAFREIEAATGRTGAECVYVGDNPKKDFEAPRRLGWRTLRVRRPGGEHAAADGGGADLECEDLDEGGRLLGLDG